MDKIIGVALLNSTRQPGKYVSRYECKERIHLAENRTIFPTEDGEDRRKNSMRKPTVWSVEGSWEDSVL
jgi:hypothetical protein